MIQLPIAAAAAIAFKLAHSPMARRIAARVFSRVAGIAAAKMVGNLQARGANIPNAVAAAIPYAASIAAHMVGGRVSPEEVASQTVQELSGHVPLSVGEIDASVARAQAQAARAAGDSYLEAQRTRPIFTPPRGPLLSGPNVVASDCVQPNAWTVRYDVPPPPPPPR